MENGKTSENNKKTINEGIDLIEVLNKIWAGRWTVIKTMIVFLIIGVLYIIFSPKKYMSEITLVVETNSTTTGLSSLIQQFGGLSGISLDKKGKDALSPELYSEVILSKPFLLEIMKQKVTESKYDSTITIAAYLERHTRPSPIGIVMEYTIGLPGKLIGLFKSDEKDNSALYSKIMSGGSDSTADTTFNPLKISKAESNTADALAACIKTDDDFKKTSKFIISVEMQDPLVVAQVTGYIVKNLTKSIIEYRTKKAKNDLKFVSARTAEAEAKYLVAQQSLASYKDRNKNVILSSVIAREDQLKSEYALAFEVYSTLAKQLEQAKIKVQDETPVFNVVNPAQVPLEKSKPKTSLTMIIALFFGAWFGVVIIYAKGFLKNLRQKK